MPDYMIGVSAGAAYGVSMASGQIGRNLKILIDYRNDKRYVGLSNMVHRDNRSLYGLNFTFDTIQMNLCLMIMMHFTDIKVLSNVL